jgi:hypothetical protein
VIGVNDVDSVATRLENAKLSSAIDNARSRLPDGCIVRIDLSQGAGVVTLEIDGVAEHCPGEAESMAEAINDAVKFAVSKIG